MLFILSASQTNGNVHLHTKDAGSSTRSLLVFHPFAGFSPPKGLFWTLPSSLENPKLCAVSGVCVCFSHIIPPFLWKDESYSRDLIAAVQWLRHKSPPLVLTPARRSEAAGCVVLWFLFDMMSAWTGGRGSAGLKTGFRHPLVDGSVKLQAGEDGGQRAAGLGLQVNMSFIL